MLDVRGSLAGVFTRVAFKRLTPVEAAASRSNQHEFNASAALRAMFGREQPLGLETDFVWIPDDGALLVEEGVLTWYDARARHPKRSEYRLYYRDNPVTTRAQAGDLLIIGRRRSGRVLMLMAPGEGLAADRIAWLFGIYAAPGASFATLGAGLAAADPLSAFDLSLAGEEGWEAEAEAEMEGAVDLAPVRSGAAADQNRVSRVTEQGASWNPRTTAADAPVSAGLEEALAGLFSAGR